MISTESAPPPGYLRSVAGLSLLGFLMIAAGCGGSRGDVSGKVTYHGKTLTVGTVQIEGADNILKETIISPDGTYTIKDVAAGKGKFAVASANPNADLVSGDGKEAPRKVLRKSDQAPLAVSKGKVEGWFPIPKEFQDISKPKLFYEVKSGQNTIEIELK